MASVIDNIVKEAEEKAANLPDTPAPEKPNALAQFNGDPFAAYGSAASRRATFIRFAKGDFLSGQSGDEVKAGTRFVADMNGLEIGWVYWKNKKPAERRMGALVSGFIPARRDELGDTDESKWPKDKNGKPQDPWQLTNELPIRDVKSGDTFVFTTSSVGGRGAVGELCKAFSAGRSENEGKEPVIELKSDSYKHTDYGKVFVPVLELVDWQTPTA